MAATALPQSSEFFQLCVQRLNPIAVKPRLVLRMIGGMTWYCLHAIHGGAVGMTMNIAQRDAEDGRESLEEAPELTVVRRPQRTHHDRERGRNASCTSSEATLSYHWIVDSQK